MPFPVKFSRIFQHKASGGAFLFASALLAVAFANSDYFAPLYEHFLHAPIGIILGDKQFSLSASHFINDGLMAIFFFLVGLEIKRELVKGELSNFSSALLPAIAAVGGMLFPGLIYVFFNYDSPETLRGWAIPTATDIAFSLGVLSLLGSRVPLSLKILLTAIAVIDDLLAIIIIALFYTEQISIPALMVSFLILIALISINRAGIISRFPYVLGFVLLWITVLQSGVHATLAGVAAALTVPLYTPHKGERPLLEIMENDLHLVVTFVILPLFAFANAGVNFEHLSLSILTQPLTLGILLGLLLGKTIGISLTIWAAVSLGIASIPKGCTASAIVSVSILCGIGFTVSLFIGNLAFSDTQVLNQVRVGVLGGSILAGLLGFLTLRYIAFPEKK